MPFAVASIFPPLQDGDQFAAVDIGSNSFHMVVARYTLGQLRVVDRLRETVRMADGLDGKGASPPSTSRGLQCLPVRPRIAASVGAGARRPPTPAPLCRHRTSVPRNRAGPCDEVGPGAKKHA